MYYHVRFFGHPKFWDICIIFSLHREETPYFRDDCCLWTTGILDWGFLSSDHHPEVHTKPNQSNFQRKLYTFWWLLHISIVNGTRVWREFVKYLECARCTFLAPKGRQFQDPKDTFICQGMFRVYGGIVAKSILLIGEKHEKFGSPLKRPGESIGQCCVLFQCT